VAEALCAGRPVLVNPVGELKEQIINGFNGFYANCYNISELAEKIIKISGISKKELHGIGLEAKEDVLKRFGSEIRAQKLLKVYESVM
jgi:glycosyltransferase involved in cell wall biosynthesis